MESPRAIDPTAFYLAARYSRRDEMLGVRDVLVGFGHEVTSEWIEGGHQAAPDDENAMLNFACEDLRDLHRADTVLCFTETPREPHTNRGGRHVEMGIALGLGKRVIVVGPLENAFTTLAKHHFPDWSRFVMWLVASDRAQCEWVC